MKNNYKFYSALLLGLLGIQGLHAQTTEANLERTKQVLTYSDLKAIGDEFGADTDLFPTHVKDYFYDNKGKLLKTLDSNVLKGDIPATLTKIEKKGDINPQTFTNFVYDDQERLSAIVQREYKTENGWFYQWSVNDTLTVNYYDEQSRLIKKKGKKATTCYQWEGSHLIAEETTDNRTSSKLVSKHYYNFASTETNLPCKVIEEFQDSAFYVEVEYNENALVKKRTKYKLTNAEKDEQGNITNGEKGVAVQMDTYSYEDLRLKAQATSIWMNDEFVESHKIESVWNNSLKAFVNRSYDMKNGQWLANEEGTIEKIGNYNFSLPTADITTEPNELLPNTTILSFTTPDDMDTNSKWSVYRNGKWLGYANFFENSWRFEDKEVANGQYDYFVMLETDEDVAISATSECVFNEKTPEVSGVKVLESGHLASDKEIYCCNIIWDAPKAQNTILGYNIYLNPKEGAPLTAPLNKSLIQTPFYELQLENYDQQEVVVGIQAVYTIGYSNPVVAKLQINKENVITSKKVCSVSKVITFGDTMGSTPKNQASGEEVSFYDKNHQLTMSVNYGYLFGDDRDTPELEKKGDKVPTKYTLYDYNEKGQLTQIRTREFGVFSGYDRAWNKDFTIVEENAYDENTGKLVEHKEINKTYRYTWEGDQLITESLFASRNNSPLCDITYSDFSDKGVNLPQYALSVSKRSNMTSYNTITEYEYDEKGRLIAERVFKFGDNIEKNEQGVVIKADKGQPKNEKIYEYEGDFLKRILENKWKSSAKELRPYSMTIYTQTANGIREEGYLYNDVDAAKGWSESTFHKETVSQFYYEGSEPSELTLTDIKEEVNSVRLTCNTPSVTWGDEMTYEVYRNGCKIGEATPDGSGHLTFEDHEVENGIWHYFIKPTGSVEAIGSYCTNRVEKVFNTPLPEATNIQFPINGKTDDGKYQLVVTWDSPETKLKIKGYNVFTDIQKFTKNPSPVNGTVCLPENERSYEFIWQDILRPEKTICIEVVYNIGKQKSANIPVTIQSTPVGILAAQNVKHLTFKGNTLHINGDYSNLEIFAANGKSIMKISGQHYMDLSTLPAGMYVIRLTTANDVESLKIIK